MSRRFTYYGSLSSFDPLAINGLELYINSNDATPSSWVDQSPNAFDFEQSTVTKQPSVLSDRVKFDGVNDIQVQSVANVNGLDSSGIIFFSGYRPSDGAGAIHLCSSDQASNNKHILISLNGSGVLSIQVKSLPSFDNIAIGTIVVSPGDYFYGYFQSTGSLYLLNTNGTTESATMTRDFDDGKWFSSVPNRDNYTTGGLKRTTEIGQKGEMNKVIYSNGALTAQEILDINNFMSNPAN